FQLLIDIKKPPSGGFLFYLACIMKLMFFLINLFASLLALGQPNGSNVADDFKTLDSKIEGRFEFNIKNTPLDFVDSILHVEMLKCYIGNIEFLNLNKEIVGKDTLNYRLLDFSNRGTLNFSIPGNSTTAHFIRLTLGVDSITNSNGVHCCALDPANGMYWSWQSGYIQFKLEGKDKRGQAFNLHLGGFTHAQMSSISTEIPIIRLKTNGPILPKDKRSQDLIIHLNLDSFLELVHINREYTLMSPNRNVQQYMNALSTSFSAVMK
ncbi:MAG: MbnP family protein, partial [Bacteroidota bacterium]